VDVRLCLLTGAFEMGDPFYSAYHTTMPAMFRPLYYLPITFVATVALTFVTVALMQKVPFLRRVV
jgi:hypothetical protein